MFKRKKLDIYRIIEHVKAVIRADSLDSFTYYTIEQKVITFFGKEKWKGIKGTGYDSHNDRTWDSEKKANDYITLNMFKNSKRVVKVIESRDSKLNKIRYV